MVINSFIHAPLKVTILKSVFLKLPLSHVRAELVEAYSRIKTVYNGFYNFLEFCIEYSYKGEIMNSEMRTIKESAGLSFGLGIGLIALGTFAIYSVVAATFISVFLVGWLLILAGFIQLGYAFWSRNWSGFLLQLLTGLFSLVGGGLILYNPLIGAASLTLFLSFLFIVQGIVRIVMALTKKFTHWVWVAISGIVTLALGILILYQWPYSSLYIIGLFVGIDLIFAGWSLVMLSLLAKKIKE
jgi:uncharacterized membrane protein HdeD (DUF308 family)